MIPNAPVGKRVLWACLCGFLGIAAAFSADVLKTAQQSRVEEVGGQSGPNTSDGVRGVPDGSQARLAPLASSECPDSGALGLLKHQVSYQRTEDLDPFEGLGRLEAKVWQRGPIAAFYIAEPLHGFAPGVRMAYLFDGGGFRGGGTCPIVKDWRQCVADLAGPEYATEVARTCESVLDVRSIPAWRPSADDGTKRRIADEIRAEVEVKWQGVREIVIRDFNLKDNQIVIYLKMPDGEYFQGCGFRALGEPHCVGWHLFGQAPLASIRKRIFEMPYRLK